MNEYFPDALYEWRARYTGEGSARESAYRAIREKIIFLDYKPGEALNDKLLAEELNMSRTPVREALIILSTVNMVVMKPQAGTFVAPIDAEWLANEQFSRYTTEKEIVTLACANVTDEIRRKYEENLRTYALCCASNAPDRVAELLKLDNEFHRIAFTAAGMEDNYFHMRNYMQHIERLRVLSLLAQIDKELNRDHFEISRAIIEGDRISAQYWTKVHLNRYIESMKAIREAYPEYFKLR